MLFVATLEHEFHIQCLYPSTSSVCLNSFMLSMSFTFVLISGIASVSGSCSFMILTRFPSLHLGLMPFGFHSMCFCFLLEVGVVFVCVVFFHTTRPSPASHSGFQCCDVVFSNLTRSSYHSFVCKCFVLFVLWSINFRHAMM